MSSVIKSVPYGSTYPPLYFDESLWERDLAMMRDAHMDIIRLGDVGTWERVEARQGEYDLDRLARFYELANAYDIHILLSTGTACPPLWLVYAYPDVRIVSSRGEDYPLGASYHWACIHHPGYLEACEKYIRLLAEFAVSQPNHYGWQISNEMGFPFNPTREAGDIDLYDYNAYSKQAFVEWLRDKYQTLDALTEAWTWATTNFKYMDWSEAFPPEAPPKVWSSVTRWIDWRLFWQQAFADHAGWQHQVIREIDSDHPTSVNIFNFKGYDRFGTFTGLDQWKMAEQVDHIGYDLYPGSGNKLATRPEHNSIFLDHGRSVSHYAGSAFWLHEIESGPIGGWLMGPEHNTKAEDILTMCFESLGHDGKLLVYMPWREWDFMPLHWGSLIDLQGNPTPRYEAAAQVGAYIKDNDAFLKAAHVPKGEIAILEDKANAIFTRGVDQEDDLFRAQRGAYRAFWEQGYSVDFITTQQVLSGEANDYRMICMPLMGILTLETMKALNQYVKQGGVLVGLARMGTMDERGWYQHQLPQPPLGEIFGLERIAPDTLEAETITFEGKSYQTWLNRDILTVESGVEIPGEFEDGLPAITLKQHGDGYGLYIATQADAAHLQSDEKLLRDASAAVAERMGLKPRMTISTPEQHAREIDPHILESPERTEVILTSYLNAATTVTVRLLEKERRVEQVVHSFLDNKPLAFNQYEEGVELAIDINAGEVKTFSIFWKTE